MLWRQALDSAHARQIPNTEGAGGSLLVAGQFLHRILPGRLSRESACPRRRRFRVAGEKSVGVDNVSGGGAWNKPGTIVFAPGLTGGLSKAAAGGGTPQALTTLNAVRNEHAHPWPRVSAVRQSFHFFLRR